MKELPYFRWFPADAKADENYSAMTDEQLGFYHRCLDHSWLNNGIPANLDELACVMKLSRKQIDKRWERVGKCFEVSARDPDRLFNQRQEEEREEARKASERARSNIQKRYHGTTTVEKSYASGSTTNTHPSNTRAVVCESECESSVNLKPEENIKHARDEVITKPILSRDFPQFWQRWCELTKRKQKESNARTAWISVVEPEFAPAAMACLERYGASDEVSRGIVANPDNWIYTQARDNFTGEWQRVHRNGHGPPEPEYPKELM